MRTALTRGLLIGVVAAIVVTIYVLIRYGVPSIREFLDHVSTDLFQIGLLLLIVGVVIFTRLFSFRRRMGLKQYGAMMRSKTKEEYEEHIKVSEELTEKEEEEYEESGRNATWLFGAITAILISILLTVNQL
jgi:purine-cytosine permease-like protein